MLARWHIESATAAGIEKAKAELRQFLESEPEGQRAADAWRQLAFACFKTGDTLGEVHAFIERSQLADVPFHDVSNTANRLNAVLREQGPQIQYDERRALASRIFAVMQARVAEADSDDLSKMAWLAIHLGQEGKAHDLVRAGLNLDPTNYYCQRLAVRFGLSVDRDLGEEH